MTPINPKLAWKVISSRYISRDPWFTVREECVELPNGVRIPDYHVLDYPTWVNVIATTPDGKMVMVQQYRHGLEKVSFELAGGISEKEESSPLESAKRELQEETGYGGGTWKEYTVLCANPATTSNLTYTFLAENVVRVSDQKLDAGEALTAHLFEKSEVLAMLQKNEICQALMAAALWKYFYEHGIK